MQVDVDDAVRGSDLAASLSKPTAWQGWIRKNLLGILDADAAVVVAALHAATLPKPPDPSPGPTLLDDDAEDVTTREHVRIQRRLVALGRARGLGVWLATGDQNLRVDGRRLSDEFDLLAALPTQFAPDALRVIEYIDVLWFKGNAVVAAFEVESTTAVYSGLLRMSDLVSVLPNARIPLYLVAPEARREKVHRETARPTFARLDPPLARVCRYLSFEALHEAAARTAAHVAHVDWPSYLRDLSEEIG